MHPIEMLRFVARGDVVSQRVLLRDAGDALAAFAWDPPGLVLACRRLVALQTGSASLVWLAARALGAMDPAAELEAARRELATDSTEAQLRSIVPRGATVWTLRGAEVVPRALAARDDVAVHVLTSDERLPAHVGPGQVVAVEARGVGPDDVLALAGSAALVTSARAAGASVVLVGGVGRVLPAGMWEPFVAAALGGHRHHADELELFPLDLVDTFVGPTASTAPNLPELFAGIVV